LNLYNQWGIKPIGRQTVFYFLVYPTSFFLFSAYTESLFLVMVLLALHYMKNQSWGWAGFWTFCAVLTRLQGAALFMPMAYLMWKDSRFLRNPHHWSGAAIAAAGPVFYIYLRSTLAVASIIPLNEPNLYARLVPPWTSYMYALQTLLSGRSNHVDLLNWFVFTLFSLLLVIGWHKIPLEYNLFALASLLITITRLVHSQPLVSMSRYSLTIFPVFYILSMADQFPLTRRVIIYTFITLNLYLSAEFFGWGFVA
jgi:Gpi18-like mannosyltransferase